MKKTFKINNHVWKIEEKSDSELLNEFKRREPEAYACFGLTFYKEHKIWIAKNMCYDQKMSTLKHELVHCYIWEMGFYNVDFNNEELICDFVSSVYNFISEVIR